MTWFVENTASCRRRSQGKHVSIEGLDAAVADTRLICSRVLEEILSGKATEDAITEIHGYLTAIGNDLRDGKIDLDDLIVFKVCSLEWRLTVQD